MSRAILSLTALTSALLPLILDSLLKGFALLAAAALVTLALIKASAAIRHLVWQVAVVALLVVPVLSLALPQWRILPAWPASPLVDSFNPPASERSNPAPELPVTVESLQAAPATVAPNLVSEHGPRPPLEALPSAHHVEPAAHSWRHSLPLAWATGVALLMLRLLAAHLLLRRTARRGTVLSPATPAHQSIAAALSGCRLEIGVRQRVPLLLDERRTIPVVFGVFRPRLLLPAEALEWDDAQLRSVLLHELAHIKRRDPLVQGLAQLACALHWWNPLVWLAAWRLHVERERSCDDLVLASGVRPSAYAEHLLHVATRLSPAPWAQGCGLAMARKSSLEGRLMAVLSERLNRRRVTRTLAAVTLLVGAAIAIPLSMLRAAEAHWNPPHAAHIDSNDFTAYCVHDGKDTSLVLVYRGSFSSTSSHTSNSKTRTWSDEVTLTLKTKNGKNEVAFRRTHAAPDTLTLARQDYDLARGRAFLLGDDGNSIRQLPVNPPAIDTREALDAFAMQIATELVAADQTNKPVPPDSPQPGDQVEHAPLPEVAAKRQLAELEVTLTKLRAELALRRQTYGPKHPKIVALQRQLDETVRAHAAHAADQAMGESAPKPAAAQEPPKGTQLFNDNYSALGVMSAEEVHFVLVYEGFLSTGMQNWVSGSGPNRHWGFDGFVHLVDREKTRKAGRNIDKRKIAVKYTSDAPNTLFLDGNAHDLSRKARPTSMGGLETPGRVFILRNEGDPLQTKRTLPLRNKEDLVTLGDFAVHDRFLMETYADSRRVQAMDGWVLGWDVQHPIQHGDGQLVAQMRIFPDGRVLSLNNGRRLKELRVPVPKLDALLRWLAQKQQVVELKPDGIGPLNPNDTRAVNMWDQTTDYLIFTCNGKRYGLIESTGDANRSFASVRERLWRFRNEATSIVPVARDADPVETEGIPGLEPAAGAKAGKTVKVNIFETGAINLNGKRVTLDVLKAELAKEPDPRVHIRAHEELPFAKLLEVIDALKAVGVEDLSIGSARVTDSKFLVANRTGKYDAGNGRTLFLCRPSNRPHWFTVIWPTPENAPKKVLKVHPNTSPQNHGNWAVAWQPGQDVLWWVDDSDVGKVLLADPAKAPVIREARQGPHSPEFGLPEDLKNEFRQLGFAIGNDAAE